MVEAVDGGTAELRPDPERAEGWSLMIDGAPQSHVDLADPSHLAFPYQRRLGHVIDLVAPAGQPLRVLHLGGGALTLARYVGVTRPRSTQQVVEKDAALVRLVRRVLPLDPQARVKVREGDAREGLGRVADGWADLVVADVFSGARTPAHLTSVEFLAEVRRVLAPGGWYAGNLADGPPLAYLRGQVATAAAVFPEVAVAADPVVWRGKRFGNAVLVAAGQPVARGGVHPEGGGGSAPWAGGARGRVAGLHRRCGGGLRRRCQGFAGAACGGVRLRGLRCRRGWGGVASNAGRA